MPTDQQTWDGALVGLSRTCLPSRREVKPSIPARICFHLASCCMRCVPADVRSSEPRGRSSSTASSARRRSIPRPWRGTSHPSWTRSSGKPWKRIGSTDTRRRRKSCPICAPSFAGLKLDARPSGDSRSDGSQRCRRQTRVTQLASVRRGCCRPFRTRWSDLRISAVSPSTCSNMCGPPRACRTPVRARSSRPSTSASC